MKTPGMQTATWRGADLLPGALAAALLVVAMLMIFLVAPEEETMGDVQRIVYIHVAAAWCALVGIVIVGIAGALYLWRRNLTFDAWGQAAAEAGWLCSLLTLITGSLWAHEAWNTWWTWDPRLTATLILWGIYSGYLLLRRGVDDAHHRARLGAVTGLLGLFDVPLIIMATRWFRGMHPVSPGMTSLMRLTLLAGVTALATFFALSIIFRRRQLDLAARLRRAEERAGSALLPRKDETWGL